MLIHKKDIEWCIVELVDGKVCEDLLRNLERFRINDTKVTFHFVGNVTEIIPLHQIKRIAYAKKEVIT